MNFRDLVTRLDLIEDAGLTLATVQAAEQAAKEKASVEKAKGGWTGFTSWDPKSAGNIAIAKLAQQNKLEGLFNIEGDFIIAYGNNEWSSKEGQAPRTAPPTPEDWKPLASRGLIPSNAKGPAGLTSWLSGGKSDNEFKAAKDQSAGVMQAAMQQPEVAPDDVSSEVPAEQSLDSDEVIVPKSGNTEPSEKAKEVDDLLNQFLSMNDNDSENSQVVTEGMYKSLVESFGYTVNENAAGKAIDVAKGVAIGGGLGAGFGTIMDRDPNIKEGMFGIKWDEDIVPPIPYTLRDLVQDVIFTSAGMTIGALGGPVGETAAIMANASRIERILKIVQVAGKTIIKNTAVKDPMVWLSRLKKFLFTMPEVVTGNVAANAAMDAVNKAKEKK